MTVIGETEAYRTTNLPLSFLSLSHSEAVTLEAKVVSRSRRLITLEGKMLGSGGNVRTLATAQQMTTRKEPPD